MKLAPRMLAAGMLTLVTALAAHAQPGMPKPGPEQEKLRVWVGDWDCTMDMMGSQGKGTATCRMVMGGFFMEMDFKGEFGGMTMTGRGVSGYCPVRKKYQGTWIDSFSPSITITEGTYTDANTFVEYGEGPNIEGKMEKMKNVIVHKDADTIEMTMYKIENGKEEKTLGITYKRKK